MGGQDAHTPHTPPAGSPLNSRPTRAASPRLPGGAARRGPATNSALPSPRAWPGRNQGGASRTRVLNSGSGFWFLSFAFASSGFAFVDTGASGTRRRIRFNGGGPLHRSRYRTGALSVPIEPAARNGSATLGDSWCVRACWILAYMPHRARGELCTQTLSPLVSGRRILCSKVSSSAERSDCV
ncbi:hypothetical protein C8Q76DRAFT_367705 [Earliella scabrosa]|nr:hypothetical protein C8Q76DRAFT_367705 [Earliella scabrosa]